MLVTLTRESLALLRHPTSATIHELRRDDWRSGLLFFLVTTGLALGLQLLTSVVQAPIREAQKQQVIDQLGTTAFAGVYDALQSPSWLLGMGLAGSVIGFVLWFVVPYGLGRVFGGTPSFGAFTYANALATGPLTVLDALFALLFSGVAGGLFLILSLSLDAFRFYLVYANLRGTMDLPRWKAGVIIGLPIVILLLLCSVLFVFVFVIAFSAGLRR